MEVDGDNMRVKNNVNNSIFIMLKGLDSSDRIGLMKVSRKNLNKTIGILKDM